MIENFWVGLYSVAFSAIPMLLVGCFLAYPLKYQRRLQNSFQKSNFMTVFSSLRKKYLRILIIGYIMFFSLMVFLSLFIIAFSEKANMKLSLDWIQSSFIGIFIDQVLFELVAASAVAIIVLAQKKVRCCRFLLFIAIFVELYRIYRNLSD